jgi:hypothetical protein
MILTCSSACTLKEISIVFTSITVIIETVLTKFFYIMWIIQVSFWCFCLCGHAAVVLVIYELEHIGQAAPTVEN